MIFVVHLPFSANRADAGAHLDAHRQWIARGIEDGVFLLVGNLEPGAGGAIVAHGVSAEELRNRLAEDPFVAADVVRAEVVEIAPKQGDPRLDFLLS